MNAGGASLPGRWSASGTVLARILQLLRPGDPRHRVGERLLQAGGRWIGPAAGRILQAIHRLAGQRREVGPASPGLKSAASSPAHPCRCRPSRAPCDHGTMLLMPSVRQLRHVLRMKSCWMSCRSGLASERQIVGVVVELVLDELRRDELAVFGRLLLIGLRRRDRWPRTRSLAAR